MQSPENYHFSPVVQFLKYKVNLKFEMYKIKEKFMRFPSKNSFILLAFLALFIIQTRE